jgi:hypothetical protein
MIDILSLVPTSSAGENESGGETAAGIGRLIVARRGSVNVAVETSQGPQPASVQATRLARN